ncbi:MAG: hypothetical protein IIZ78_14335 [Clostridiales bacterium]|nr:hypothetical protein [Clostridiales bacterium]
MTDSQKLTTVKTLIEDGSGYMPSDETLNTYISIAGNEILAWMYHLVGGVPDDVAEVPTKYEQIQIYAVVVGWTHAGAEGQGLSIENGVHRDFRYSDMLDYIHNNVLPIARVGAVT